MMKKYSFRLVLRDMIKHQDQFRIQDLTHYCSSKVVQGYCDLLYEMGAILKEERGDIEPVSPQFIVSGPPWSGSLPRCLKGNLPLLRSMGSV